MLRVQRAVAKAALLVAGSIIHASTLQAQIQGPTGSSLDFYLKDSSAKPVADAHVRVRTSGASCLTDERGRCSIVSPLRYADVDILANGYEGMENRFAAPDEQGRIVIVLTSNDEAKALAERVRFEAEQSERRRRENEAAQKAYDEAAAKAWAERSRVLVKEMPTDAICAAMGSIYRNEGRLPLERLVMGIDAAIVTAEAARRRIQISKSQAVRETLAVGMSECSLLASYGMPEDRNRSVGPWGTKVQYVYRELGTYVYTSNGKVTGWQN